MSLEPLRTVRYGLVLATAAILFGFILGGLFGAFEHAIQDSLKASGEAVLSTVYANDSAKLEGVLSKSWTYFKRAHMHGGGIGTSALALSLVLAFLPGAARLRSLLAGAMGLGALGYSTFWLLAGMRAPALGGTGAAKETLQWLAIPSAGLLIVGVTLTLGLLVWSLWRPQGALTTP